jgi:ferrochelatase
VSTAVLLMSYGTPSGPEVLESYYTHIRRGRPPTEEQLADLRRRYDAIGGVSPLAERTRAQATGVQAALEEIGPGRFRVFTAAKHAPPYLEDGVGAVAAAGHREMVALVLAPHYSALSVGEYIERVEETGAELGVEVRPVRGWPTEPALVELLAQRLRRAMASVGTSPEDTLVLVTAHSLPRRVLEMNDPYPDQLRQTAEAVVAAAGVPRWRVAWQSAGRTPEPWLGPDVLEELETAAGEGAAAVVVCPAGFTSDHLEVLYDLDIEARARAERLGLAFARTASLNDDPRFCALVADLARRAADHSGL